MKNFILILLIIPLYTLKSQNLYGKFGDSINYTAEDSSFSTSISVRMQNLFTGQYNIQSENFESNFLVRRARLKFNGYSFSPKLTYKVELGLSNRDLNIENEDGNVSGASRIIFDMLLRYQFQKHWSIWAGQTKLPGNRERVVSSADLQFVDRSLVNRYFNIDRDVGIQLHGEYYIGKDFIIQPKFSFSQGEGRNITTGNKGGFCYTGRVDILPFGKFEGDDDEYILSDLNRQSKPKLALGVTYNFNHKTVRQQGQLGKYVYEIDNLGNRLQYTDNYSLSSVLGDMIFKYKGFSMLNEVAYSTVLTSKDYTLYIPRNNEFNKGLGINSQIGYLFNNNIEIALRNTNIITYSHALNGFQEYTICLSKYIVGHRLKIQTDASWITERGNTGYTESVRCRAQIEMQF